MYPVQRLINRVAYVVLLLPYSVTRLMDISGFKVSFGANVFAYTCTLVLGKFPTLSFFPKISKFPR